MTDMFYQQPIELIADEQLVRLPIADLLTACRSSTEFSDLCKNPEIWIGRMQNEYPGVIVPQGVDPRTFYLRKKLFGGEIYVHYTDTYNLDVLLDQKIVDNVTTQQVAPEIIEYDDLFVRTKQIAEALNRNAQRYVIVYSRPITDALMNIEIIAFQTKNNVAIIPGRNSKITLVDIVYIHRNAHILDHIDLFNLITLGLQSGDDPIAILGLRQMSRAEAQNILDDRTEFLVETVDRSLIKYHEKANTNFYQRERSIILEKAFELSGNVRIPQLSDIMIKGDVQTRKDDLLNFIITNVRQDLFRNAGQNMDNRVLGFVSYEEFIAFQGNHISTLNEEQLRTLETVINLLPYMENSKEEQMRSFAITYDGNIALLQSGGAVQAIPLIRM